MPQLMLYMTFCALTAIGGIDRRGGFFTFFFLALVLTPLIVLPVLLISAPLREIRRRKRS
jgi:hypothetical protein